MDDLRVHVAMNDDDIAKGMKPLQAIVNKQSAPVTGLAFLCTILFVVALFFILGQAGFYKTLYPAVAGLIAAYVALVIFCISFSVFLKIKPYQLGSAKGALKRAKDIVINAEGVHQSTAEDKSFYSWPGILRVEQDDHTILFYVDTSSAFLIPKRSFADDAAAAQFYNQACTYWAAAHPAAPWAHVKPAEANGIEGDVPNMPFSQWYFHNLLCGLRQAVFVPSTKPFVASGHALAAILATFFFSQGAIEVATNGWGGELAHYWYLYFTCLAAITVGMAYIISGHIYKSPDKSGQTLGITVAFLNSFYFLFLPYAVLRIVYPDTFYAHNLHDITKGIFTVWSALVLLSLTNRIYGLQNLFKPIVAAAVAGAALYIFVGNVYFSNFYYGPEDDGEAEVSVLDQLTSEEVFTMQAALREKALQNIKPSKAGQTDIYALNLAPYGYQDIFMREVHYVGTRLQEKLGITNVIPMISNEATVQTTALANTSNLNAYLQRLSHDYMQPDEDIALIFMTSHGDAKEGLAVGLGYDFSQLGMSPERLKKILDDSGIKNKIIIISACHSGTFIPHLQDANTMVIAAAATDRTSFGCSDEFDLTYFTEAYFKVGLEETTDLEEAFALAKAEIERREVAQNILPTSNPQIFVGDKIKEALRKYKAAPRGGQKKKAAPPP